MEEEHSTAAQSAEPNEDGWFPTTHWSVVLAATDDSSPHAADALERLCRAYWKPLYAYSRKLGHDPDTAQDVTQDFFIRVLERDLISQARRDRGRFRSFLLTTFRNFLVNEWKKGQAIKRGGGQANFVSLDDDEKYGEIVEAADERTAEKYFERRWALAVLEQALARLRSEMSGAGKSQLFDALKDFVWGEHSGMSYAQMAGRLGMSQAAVKVAVHRLRGRFREALRSEIAMTVASPEQIEEERRCLMTALASP